MLNKSPHSMMLDQSHSTGRDVKIKGCDESKGVNASGPGLYLRIWKEWLRKTWKSAKITVLWPYIRTRGLKNMNQVNKFKVDSTVLVNQEY
jgi:hypothetical protein